MGVFLWRVREIKEGDGERKFPRVYWDRLKFKVFKGPLFSSTITKYFIFDSHPYSERRSNRVYTMILRTTRVSIWKRKECLLLVLLASWRNQHIKSCDSLLQSTLQLRGLTFRRRNFLLNFSTPVFKMWIIQEPKKVSLWNKWHFEEEKTESVQHV
jgi:hypothetical protein